MRHTTLYSLQEYLEKVLQREPDVSEKRAKNIAFVEHLDAGVGRLMKELKSGGKDKNTLVVFTSDNGGALRYAQSNGKLRGGKKDMYEGGIRVPALIKWGDNLKKGRIIDDPITLMDIYPTLCDIVGLPVAENIDGRSFRKILQSNTTESILPFTIWVRREGGFYGGLSYYAAREGNYKLVQNTPFEPFQYFDIANDPYEKNPLDLQEDNIGKRLRYRLQQHIIKSGSVPWQD